MTGTTILALNRSMQTTMEWLNEIQAELGWEDDERVYNATKAVLHTIRDRLPLEEAAKFSAQLPMIMKGMYFDQYDPTGKPLKLRSREDFLNHVRENFPDPAFNPEDAVRGVMKGIGKRTNWESTEKFALNMPESIRDLLLGERVRR